MPVPNVMRNVVTINMWFATQFSPNALPLRSIIGRPGRSRRRVIPVKAYHVN
jgi:hypothetical protein